MNILRAMLNFSMVQKSMGKSYEEIFALILNHAKIVDEKVLLARMDELFRSCFLTQFKMTQEEMLKSKGVEKKVIDVDNGKVLTVPNSLLEKKVI